MFLSTIEIGYGNPDDWRMIRLEILTPGADTP